MPYPHTVRESDSRPMDTDMVYTLVEVLISVPKKQTKVTKKKYGQYVAVLKLPHLYGRDKVVCLSPNGVVKNIVCCQPVHPKPIATTCGHTY